MHHRHVPCLHLRLRDGRDQDAEAENGGDIQPGQEIQRRDASLHVHVEQPTHHLHRRGVALDLQQFLPGERE
jgi:hypothetical protein